MAKYIRDYTYWSTTDKKLFQYGDKVLWENDVKDEDCTECQSQSEVDALFTEYKEEYKKSINDRMTSYVDKQLKELDYDSLGEVSLYANNMASRWHTEAKALQLWVNEIYEYMYGLFDLITIDNPILPIDDIESKYPKFEVTQ